MRRSGEDKSSTKSSRRFPRIGRTSLGGVATVLSLLAVFVLAVIARIGPMKYAFQINSVDPWFYYMSASYALTHGFQAWFHWKNTMEFYPYGKFVPLYESPMLVVFSVLAYEFVRALNVNTSFFALAVELPVVLTAVAAVMMYFWGTEIGGKKTGILAALFLALSPANIAQTSLGDFKDEFLAFFFLVPALFFLFRALRTGATKDMLLSGVFTALAVSSWGPVSPYMYDMPALIVFFSVISARISPSRGLKMLALVCAPSLLMASVLIRDIGGLSALVEESPVFIAFLFSVLKMYYNQLGESARVLFKSLVVILGAAIIVGVAVLVPTGIGGRILAIVDPFFRGKNPIVTTVAENELTTWFDFYTGFNVQMLLLPVAAYLFYRRSDAAGIGMVLFIVTATYFTATYVRAEEILTPVAAIAAAYVISKLFDTFGPLLTRAYRATSSNRRSGRGVDWEIGGILIVLILVSGTYFAYQGLVSAEAPPLMLQGPNGGYSTDWVQALLWIKYNTPPNSVVASWWDYGYWIMAYADRPTLADPSTVNTTQIQALAIALMSNSTISHRILSFYGAKYVLVYQPLTSSPVLPTDTGDLGKSQAMLTIAASTNFERFDKAFNLSLTAQPYQNVSNYFNVESVPHLGQIIVPNGKYASQTTLYDLMFGGDPQVQTTFGELGSVGVSVPTFSVPSGFQLVYHTADYAIMVYEVT